MGAEGAMDMKGLGRVPREWLGTFGSVTGEAWLCVTVQAGVAWDRGHSSETIDSAEERLQRCLAGASKWHDFGRTGLQGRVRQRWAFCCEEQIMTRV